MVGLIDIFVKLGGRDFFAEKIELDEIQGFSDPAEVTLEATVVEALAVYAKKISPAGTNCMAEAYRLLEKVSHVKCKGVDSDLIKFLRKTHKLTALNSPSDIGHGFHWPETGNQARESNLGPVKRST